MQHSFTRRFGASVLLLAAAACADSPTNVAAPAELDVSAPAAIKLAVDSNTVLGAATASGTPLLVGKTLTLTANSTVSRSRFVSWSSSDASVASVSSTGVVTGKAVGGVSIRALSLYGYQQFPINVISGVVATASVAVAPTSASVKVGSNVQLSATLRDANGGMITSRYPTFKSSNTSVVDVSSSGVVTGLKVGSASVTASDGTASSVAAIVVTSSATPTPPTTPAPGRTMVGIRFTPKPATMAPGSSVQFTAVTLWSDGTTQAGTFRWTIYNGNLSNTNLYTAATTLGRSGILMQLDGTSFRDSLLFNVEAASAPAPDPTPTVPASVTSYSISPKSGATLAPGTTRQFSTSTVWSDGANRSVTTTYTAKGGTINTSGLFTAGNVAGTFMAIAACSCGRVDTASIAVAVVAAPAPTLSTLAISPKNVSMVAGSTQQFGASALWSNGGISLPTLGFTATAGSVSGTGSYTAPATAGTYKVVLSQLGGLLRDTATVTVTAAVPAPIPTAGFTSNLPTSEGLGLIVDTKFGEPNVKLNYSGLDGMFYSMDNASVSGGRSVAVGDAPFSSSALETYYPGNDLGNGVGGARLYGTSGQKWKKLYFAMSVWVQQDYSIHSNGEKWLYIDNIADGVKQPTIINWELDGNETPNGSSWGLWLMPNLAYGNYESWVRYSASGKRMRKGAWQTVEVYLSMNNPGQSDGVYRVWIDGQKAIDVANVQYRPGSAQAYFDGIKFDGTRGGGASSTPTPGNGQVRRYSRLAWYASN